MNSQGYNKLPDLRTRVIIEIQEAEVKRLAEEELWKEEKQLEKKLRINSTTIDPTDAIDQTLVDSYRKLFELFDQDDNGSISVDELGHIFRLHLGKALSEGDLNKIIEQVDEDESNTIDFSEFLTLMESETWKEIEKGEIVEAFAVFDRNKDGYIDADELSFALCNYGETMSKKEADEFVNFVDQDNNGLIDFDEFKAMMSTDEDLGGCRQQ